MDYRHAIANRGLEIKAIKLNTENPFTWASGFIMPIYNDNRMFLFEPEDRRLIAEAFERQLRELSFEVIAGTSTSGISPATTLSNMVDAQFVYVRNKPKEHGLKNQIEGIDAEKDLEGRRVILIEDLISTGGSSARAVQAIRDSKGECNLCLSIFNYGLDKGEEAFRNLDPTCEVRSILGYNKLISIARNEGYITKEQEKALEEWREDPFGWGEKRGFPRVVRE